MQHPARPPARPPEPPDGAGNSGVKVVTEEGGAHINCNSRPSPDSLFFFFFQSSAARRDLLKPRHPAPPSTHTYTQAHKRKRWERDNWETTVVSYRKCITA